MTRFLLLIPVGLITVFTASCGCCTSDAKAPPLRPLPQFQQLDTAPVEVEPTK